MNRCCIGSQAAEKNKRRCSGQARLLALWIEAGAWHPDPSSSEQSARALALRTAFEEMCPPPLLMQRRNPGQRHNRFHQVWLKSHLPCLPSLPREVLRPRQRWQARQVASASIETARTRVRRFPVSVAQGCPPQLCVAATLTASRLSETKQPPSTPARDSTLRSPSNAARDRTCENSLTLDILSI